MAHHRNFFYCVMVAHGDRLTFYSGLGVLVVAAVWLTGFFGHIFPSQETPHAPQGMVHGMTLCTLCTRS